MKTALTLFLRVVLFVGVVAFLFWLFGISIDDCREWLRR